MAFLGVKRKMKKFFKNTVIRDMADFLGSGYKINKMFFRGITHADSTLLIRGIWCKLRLKHSKQDFQSWTRGKIYNCEKKNAIGFPVFCEAWVSYVDYKCPRYQLAVETG